MEVVRGLKKDKEESRMAIVCKWQWINTGREEDSLKGRLILNLETCQVWDAHGNSTKYFPTLLIAVSIALTQTLKICWIRFPLLIC